MYRSIRLFGIVVPVETQHLQLRLRIRTGVHILQYSIAAGNEQAIGRGEGVEQRIVTTVLESVLHDAVVVDEGDDGEQHTDE